MILTEALFLVRNSNKLLAINRQAIWYIDIIDIKQVKDAHLFSLTTFNL